MRLLIFLITFMSIPFLTNGQVRVITGKVVDEYDFNPIAEVRVQSVDTVLLGTTDINGNFKIELPVGIDQLILSSIKIEWILLKVPASCNTLEVIMMADGTYCFMTTRKINRKRYKKFKTLPKLHQQAYNKGIFSSIASCQTYIFQKY